MISSVNVTKSAGNFIQTEWQTSFFCSVTKASKLAVSRIYLYAAKMYVLLDFEYEIS